MTHKRTKYWHFAGLRNSAVLIQYKPGKNIHYPKESRLFWPSVFKVIPINTLKYTLEKYQITKDAYQSQKVPVNLSIGKTLKNLNNLVHQMINFWSNLTNIDWNRFSFFFIFFVLWLLLFGIKSQLRENLVRFTLRL